LSRKKTWEKGESGGGISTHTLFKLGRNMREKVEATIKTEEGM